MLLEKLICFELTGDCLQPFEKIQITKRKEKNSFLLNINYSINWFNKMCGGKRYD